MLIVLGLNAANNACPICEVHSNNRGKTSVDTGRYNGDNARKLSVMKEQTALKATKRNVDCKKGCINMPLVDIEPCDCVIEELHLFLRITDKLFDSLFVLAYKYLYTKRSRKHFRRNGNSVQCPVS